MKYRPGGYSWLGVTPESEEEQNIEQIEDQIHILHREFKKSGNEKLLQEIEQLEERIKEIKNKQG